MGCEIYYLFWDSFLDVEILFMVVSRLEWELLVVQLYVPPNVTALRKRFAAEVAIKWLASIMASEVVSQIARLLENLIAPRDDTLEILFIPQRLRIIDFYNSVPLLRYSFKELLGSLFTL